MASQETPVLEDIEKSMTYEQAQHYAFCAARATGAFYATPGITPIFDEFYWSNARFMKEVIFGTANDNLEASLFKKACEEAGIKFNDKRDISTIANDYLLMLSQRGRGEEISPLLADKKKELHRVFSKIMEISAQAARKNPPAYSRNR